MDAAKLITKQQLEIEDLKEKLSTAKEKEKSLYYILYNIGAPLNDNVDMYSHKQLGTFIRIARLFEF